MLRNNADARRCSDFELGLPVVRLWPEERGGGWGSLGAWWGCSSFRTRRDRNCSLCSHWGCSGRTTKLQINLVPRAFPSKNRWGPTHFLREKPWGRGWLKMYVACVAGVSVRFRSKERGKRVKDRAKNGSLLISRAAKTDSPVPRSIFAPKRNGHACYTG